MAGPAAATDCITPYRRSLLTMSLAAAAVLIVRGVPTEHRLSENINCHQGGSGDAVEAIHRGGDVGGDDRNNTTCNQVLDCFTLVYSLPAAGN